jgi:hypothetical protein
MKANLQKVVATKEMAILAFACRLFAESKHLYT